MREIETKRIETIDWRWHAVVTKNREFDGVFYFAVQTTGVFCRPSCASRSPKRQNVAFFQSPAEAENAGFRACMRCKPNNGYSPGTAAVLVQRAFDALRSKNEEIATIDELCTRLSVTSGYLQKIFKSTLGVSPKEVMEMMRLENFKENVRESDVTTSLYESGYGSSRSLYEKAGENLGMTPATYKKGGKNIAIRFTIADSRLGKLMVAATDKGISAVSFGDSVGEIERELRDEFFAAEISRDGENLKPAVETILKSLDGETAILNLPLDIRASAFQIRVWAELRKIPRGETRSYRDVAENLGNSNAVRAVARACATNPVALINPCHRVIASDGKLSGYRWGIERKAELLKNERTEK